MEPMLRFKADDGSDFPDWEEKTLGEICEQLKASIDPRNNPTKQFIEYSMPAYDNHMAAQVVLGQSMNSARKILSAPCVLINKLNVRKRRIWVVEHPEDNAVCSSEFVPLTSAESDLRFLGYLAMTDSFTSYLLDCSSGSSNSQKRVTPDTILQYLVSLPSLPEQRKIADLLSAVDDVISAQEAEVAAWEKRKKGVMQKLFSQEVRFKADDGSDFPDWEEQKIEDVCVLNPRTEQLDDEFYYMDLGSIDHGRWEAPEIVNKVDAPSRAQRVAAIDDVFFQSVRPYNMGHYHYVAAKDKQVVASTGYIQARMRNGSNAFLYQLFYEERFNAEVNARCTGSNYPAINSRKFGEITVALPSLPEQRKIADCLSALDDVIIKAKNELAKWQELKKGLLQQMFV